MDVPTWPGGVGRHGGDPLEFTAGGVRVAARDIRDALAAVIDQAGPA